MKHRIGMWAIAGFLVAACWALYALATTPPALTSSVSTTLSHCPALFPSIGLRDLTEVQAREPQTDQLQRSESPLMV
jgi:hypothetical protein